MTFNSSKLKRVGGNTKFWRLRPLTIWTRPHTGNFMTSTFLFREKVLVLREKNSLNEKRDTAKRIWKKKMTHNTYYHRQKKSPSPPCNHLHNGALRQPTLARHQPITCLIPSWGRQPQRTDVQVVVGGDFFLSMIVQYMLFLCGYN